MGSTKLKEQPGYMGHGDPSMPPSIRKGTFAAIGTFVDSGNLGKIYPKGISPNVKQGTPSGEGEVTG
jgi:hypothetical protein